MPKRSNQFQKLVAALHACLASDVEIEEEALLVDRDTGEKREVDIILRTEAGGYPLIVSIEVCATTRRLDTPWVETMAKKHEALPTNKLVLISQSGFTKVATIGRNRSPATRQPAIPAY